VPGMESDVLSFRPPLQPLVTGLAGTLEPVMPRRRSLCAHRRTPLPVGPQLLLWCPACGGNPPELLLFWTWCKCAELDPIE